MKILLAIHNVYTDTTSGAAHSLRILLQWLRDGGHDCRVLATGRFDAAHGATTIESHLDALGVPLTKRPAAKAFVRTVRKPANIVVGRPTMEFVWNGVPVTTLMTRAPLGSTAERFEMQQLLYLLDDALARHEPDAVLSYGGHPVIQQILARARRAGARTIFTLRNFGYDDRRFFADVDHVFTTSPYLTAAYAESIGLRSTGIPSPIDWEEVEAPTELRRFVTFVNPSHAKGVLVFARLAEMLGAQRPDIPLLVVQSATSAGRLNAIEGVDFSRYPHIMAAPATPRPADFFALTRLLLVPSLFNEPFGRVAAEALVNGIPPLVSSRGALPETVGDGGVVLPLPAHLTERTRTLPEADDVAPWFDAITRLWDDSHAYVAASTAARRAAEARYAEPVMRQRYLDYFASLDEAETLFPT